MAGLKKPAYPTGLDMLWVKRLKDFLCVIKFDQADEGNGQGWRETGAIWNVVGVGVTRMEEEAQRERKLSSMVDWGWLGVEIHTKVFGSRQKQDHVRGTGEGPRSW